MGKLNSIWSCLACPCLQRQHSWGERMKIGLTLWAWVRLRYHSHLLPRCVCRHSWNIQNIISWPMQERFKYPKCDGWKICSCPWTSRWGTELQNVHLSAPEVKCRWAAKHCWKNRSMVTPSQGWLSAPFCCSEDQNGIRHLGLLFRKYSLCKRFCSSKWEAEGHFAHGVPSKRKICLKLCLGLGFIVSITLDCEYYKLLSKTCRAELSAGFTFWCRQRAS